MAWVRANITIIFNIQYIYIKGIIMKLTREQVMGIIRHTLTFVGGIVVAKGLVDEATATEIIGGVLTLTGAIWSIVAKA
jgi:hypothetical protein